MAKVFISYRRDDAAGFSHAIYDRLAEHLGTDRVFKDVASIGAGDDFAKRIQRAIAQSKVVIALIGKRWAGDSAAGNSRLDNPSDWVRTEIAEALERGAKVIPVLLDGAAMPNESDLPANLRQLATLNALDVRSSRLEADLRDLLSEVMGALGVQWPPQEAGSGIYVTLSMLYAFFSGATLLLMGIGSLFIDSIPGTTLGGVALFLLNALILLRAPIHPAIQTLKREQALRIGAVVHLAGFMIAASGTSDLEFGMVLLFGLIPATLIFLGSFAMRRTARV